MKHLGYNFFVADKIDLNVIKNFKEPFKISHRSFDHNYSYSEDNICREINRLLYLQNSLENIDVCKYTLFEEVAKIFKKELN